MLAPDAQDVAPAVGDDEYRRVRRKVVRPLQQVDAGLEFGTAAAAYPHPAGDLGGRQVSGVVGGGAVRLALLSHTLPGEDRLWRAGGVGASVAAARTLALSALVVAAAAVGGVPLWPAPLLAVTVLVLVGLGIRFGTRTTGRIGALLEIFRSAARSPRAGGVLLAWTACSFAARIVAAVAIAMALGVSSPLLVALVLLAAMALSGALPLTPGNFGAGAGAATLALHGAGVGLGSALALGVAFQAVETFAGVVLGLVGAAVLATPGTPIRRWSLAAAGAGVVVVAAALGIATIDLV